jgi:hypothetical protein
VPSVNTNWSEYRNELGPVESFDVYVGPITSFYSQVWWAALPEARLPDHIRRRFNDTAMAIIGYEVDQVRRKGDKDRDGSILPEDISVPINVAYNHHHDAYFTGRHSRMERVPYDPSDRTVSPWSYSVTMSGRHASLETSGSHGCHTSSGCTQRSSTTLHFILRQGQGPHSPCSSEELSELVWIG